jgi:hypothetical protein
MRLRALSIESAARSKIVAIRSQGLPALLSCQLDINSCALSLYELAACLRTEATLSGESTSRSSEGFRLVIFVSFKVRCRVIGYGSGADQKYPRFQPFGLLLRVK